MSRSASEHFALSDSPYCEQHPYGSNESCRNCGTARLRMSAAIAGESIRERMIEGRARVMERESGTVRPRRSHAAHSEESILDRIEELEAQMIALEDALGIDLRTVSPSRRFRDMGAAVTDPKHLSVHHADETCWECMATPLNVRPSTD